jgi:hypothetical protein
MKKEKAIFKLNSGNLALLCSGCHKIIKVGYEFTKDEHKACKGKAYLPKQYCEKCNFTE